MAIYDGIFFLVLNMLLGVDSGTDSQYDGYFIGNQNSDG
jgi:hypothetical protein